MVLALFFKMVGMMTMVAYSSGIKPSLNLILKVLTGLCIL